MNRDRAFKIGRAINMINMIVDDETRKKVVPYLETIENEVMASMAEGVRESNDGE